MRLQGCFNCVRALSVGLLDPVEKRPKNFLSFLECQTKVHCRNGDLFFCLCALPIGNFVQFGFRTDCVKMNCCHSCVRLIPDPARVVVAESLPCSHCRAEEVKFVLKFCSSFADFSFWTLFDNDNVCFVGKSVWRMKSKINLNGNFHSLHWRQ